MIRIPLTGSIGTIVEEISTLDFEPMLDGSGQARGEGTKAGWINGLSIAALYGPRVDRHQADANRDRCPELFNAINNDLGSWNWRQIIVNRLNPTSNLDVHRDGPPYHDRYHLPVITNPKVYWWDELNGNVPMPVGFWYPVRYDILHGVMNEGPTPRIHIVVDIANHETLAL